MTDREIERFRELARKRVVIHVLILPIAFGVTCSFDLYAVNENEGRLYRVHPEPFHIFPERCVFIPSAMECSTDNVEIELVDDQRIREILGSRMRQWQGNPEHVFSKQFLILNQCGEGKEMGIVRTMIPLHLLLVYQILLYNSSDKLPDVPGPDRRYFLRNTMATRVHGFLNEHIGRIVNAVGVLTSDSV